MKIAIQGALSRISETLSETLGHSVVGRQDALDEFLRERWPKLSPLKSRLQLLMVRNVLEPLVIQPYQRRMLPVLFGPIYFQALSAAVRFDLFTLLDQRGELTLSEIAEALEIDPKEARVLLDVLVTLGFIQKRPSEEASYYNHWLTKWYLSESSPLNIKAVVDWYHYICYKPMYHFFEALKTGQNEGLVEIDGEGDTLYQRLTQHPELERIFQKAMEQISTSANRSLASYVDFSQVRSLVDVGGGNASNIIAIAQRNPHLRARIFDSPSVEKLAQENIQKAHLQDRLSTLRGDCFKDPYPQDADCFLYCHFLDIWSEEQNKFLINKTYQALPAGGQIIIFDIMQRDDGKGPLTAVAGHPYFLTLATGQGFIYSAQEYESWLTEAGFTQIQRLHLPQDHIAVIGHKA